MSYLTSLVAVLLVFQCASSKSKELPNEFRDFLNEVDSLSGRPFHDLSEDKPQMTQQSDVPNHQDGVTITNNNKTVPAVDAPCKPRLTAVDIRGNINPAYVTYDPVIFLELHRCVGSVGFSLQQVHRCAVKAAEVVTVKVFDIQANLTKHIKMLNHTQCQPDCIIQASDCDSATKMYVQDMCSCVCRPISCNTTYQQLDSTDCKCVCKDPPQLCKGPGKKVWNPDTCGCDCRSYIKKRCIRKGKQLNRASCECECPPVTCPSGTKLNKSNCTCNKA